jgi:hypothetical protein
LFDGKIKAPPSVGQHVVGLTEVIASTEKLACWHISQKYKKILHFMRRLRRFCLILFIVGWRGFGGRFCRKLGGQDKSGRCAVPSFPGRFVVFQGVSAALREVLKNGAMCLLLATRGLRLDSCTSRAWRRHFLRISNHQAKFAALPALGLGRAQINSNPHLIGQFISRSGYPPASFVVWQSGLRCVVDIATSA